MEQLTHVGTFCPNPACPNYAQSEDATVIKHGTTAQGKQRFRCKTCGKTFNENKGKKNTTKKPRKPASSGVRP